MLVQVTSEGLVSSRVQLQGQFCIEANLRWTSDLMSLGPKRPASKLIGTAKRLVRGFLGP